MVIPCRITSSDLSYPLYYWPPKSKTGVRIIRATATTVAARAPLSIRWLRVRVPSASLLGHRLTLIGAFARVKKKGRTMEGDQDHFAYTCKVPGLSKEEAALFLEYRWRLTPDVDTDPITVVWPFRDEPEYPPGWQTKLNECGTPKK